MRKQVTVLEGDFGTSFKPIVTWIQSLVSDEDKVNELWRSIHLKEMSKSSTFRLFRLINGISRYNITF